MMLFDKIMSLRSKPDIRFSVKHLSPGRLDGDHKNLIHWIILDEWTGRFEMDPDNPAYARIYNTEEAAAKACDDMNARSFARRTRVRQGNY